jgi:dTDP-4-dehydrorhamnose reductase
MSNGHSNQTFLVTGAGGLLGADLVRAWQGRPVVGLDHVALDVTDAAACRRALDEHQPSVVVNCAARASLDFCETHREEAMHVNADGARRLAEVCMAAGVRLVHISTDYVFDGTKAEPYVEEDEPRPVSVYSASKAAGERAVLEVCPEHLVVRVAWVFGFGESSFPRTVLRRAARLPTISVIGDQLGSPTYSFDIAEAISRLVEKSASGLVHFTNEGLCTRFDMARHILEQLGLGADRVQAMASTELPWVAPRPARLEVSKAKYRRLTGARVRTWQEALDEYLAADADCAALARAAVG